MIKDIIDSIVVNFSPVFGDELPVTNLSGLTFIGQRKSEGEVITYPVSVDAGKSDEYLVPGSKKRCIVWFESFGSTTKQINNDFVGDAIVELYCWYNANLFSGNNVQSKLVKLCNGIVYQKGNNLADMVKVHIVKIDENNPSILAKYSFSKAKPEVLMPPFFYFKITYNIKYCFSNECNELEIAGSAGCC